MRIMRIEEENSRMDQQIRQKVTLLCDSRAQMALECWLSVCFLALQFRGIALNFYASLLLALHRKELSVWLPVPYCTVRSLALFWRIFRSMATRVTPNCWLHPATTAGFPLHFLLFYIKKVPTHPLFSTAMNIGFNQIMILNRFFDQESISTKNRSCQVEEDDYDI
jgi:hypothetical protein